MKVVKLEAIPVRIAYKRVEASVAHHPRRRHRRASSRSPPRTASSAGANAPAPPTPPASRARSSAMAPLVIGRDAWDKEAIHRDLAIYAVWAFQPMTGNFAFAGIDMALWDALRQGLRPAALSPVRRRACARRSTISTTWNGARRRRSSARRKDGVKRGYRAYYIKAGVDEKREEAMLEALRAGIGPEGHDPHRRQPGLEPCRRPCACSSAGTTSYDIDFVEAPVRDRSAGEHARSATPGGGAALRQRGAVARGRRLPHDQEPLRRLSLLQPVLGRLAAALPPAQPGRAISRAGWSASTPMASSASPRRPASM